MLAFGSVFNIFKGYQLNDGILSGQFSPCGEKVVVTDTKGVSHIYGASGDAFMYCDTPFEQFHLLDWVNVQEGPAGKLVDTQSQQSADSVEMGSVVSIHRTAYPFVGNHLKAKMASIVTRNSLVDQNSKARKVYWEIEQSYAEKILAEAEMYILFSC